jgi:hypothetical protein
MGLTIVAVSVPSIAENRPNEVEFERLVDADARCLYRLALAIVDDPTEAEDAGQETMVITWRRLPRRVDRGAPVCRSPVVSIVVVTMPLGAAPELDDGACAGCRRYSMVPAISRAPGFTDARLYEARLTRSFRRARQGYRTTNTQSAAAMGN